MIKIIVAGVFIVTGFWAIKEALNKEEDSLEFYLHMLLAWICGGACFMWTVS